MKHVIVIATVLLGLKAQSAELICKGGLIGKNVDRFSRLRQNGNEFEGYTANSVVGGFLLQATKLESGGIEIRVLKERLSKPVLLAKTSSQAIHSSLEVPVGRGYEVSIWCAEE